MSEAVVERQVAAPAEQVWDLLRNFGDIAWIPAAGLVDVEGDGPGMRRRIHGTGAGSPVVERLISVDDTTRTIEYTIEENNPLPVTSYLGTVSVDDAGDDAMIRWAVAFEPAGDETDAAAVVRLMLDALTGWLADASLRPDTQTPLGQDN
jgi:hypothetical protein